MTAATATRLKRFSLREDFHRGGRAPLRVDREAGVIYKIKILGWESANKRRYLPEAVRKALPLYNGARAFADHPDKPTQMRGARDALGVWRNPVLLDDGLYADLHFFKSHPLAESVCEDAERGLGVFGASHNADGKGDVRDGVLVVGEIVEVRSVDLVTEPATVTNLWEGKAVQVSVKSLLLEKVLPALKAGRAKRLKALAEKLPDTLEMMEAGDGNGDHRDHMYGAMRACEEAGDHDSAKAIHRLLAPQEKEEEPVEEEDDRETDSTAGIEGPVDEEDEGEERDDDGVAEEGKKRRKRVRGAETLTESRILRLCKAAGVEATAALTDALLGATLDQGLAILEILPKKALPAASPPRSAARGVAVTESVAPRDSSGWAKRLLG